MKRFLRIAQWMGVMLMTTCLQAAEPTGASLAWTSTHATVSAARTLVEKGDFAGAEAILRAMKDDEPAGAEMLEMITRLRREYSLEARELLARLKPTLPDATLADIHKWQQAGEIQWRMIDAKPSIFRREPANLFRFCADARQRRGTPADDAPGWTLASHLSQIIAEADKAGAAYVLPVKHRVTYSLTVPPGPALKAGSVVRVWLPFPQEHRRQTEVHLISSSPAGATIAPADAPQRTVYLETRVIDPHQPVVCREVLEFTSAAYYPKLDDARARPLPADYADGNVGERLPHIVFTPELTRVVAEAVGDATNPLVRARRIFNWVSTHIAYHAEEEYGVIPSLSARGLARRRGDCGIQSMLFITMCRCAGIPARWQSGWETKPVGWDMHDWSEFYVDPWGWLPADASYGPQKSDDPRVRDFYFGHQDSYRWIVNRDYGAALHPEKHSMRSEPADFQRGEVEVDGKNLYFDQWDYSVDFEWLK